MKTLTIPAFMVKQLTDDINIINNVLCNAGIMTRLDILYTNADTATVSLGVIGSHTDHVILGCMEIDNCCPVTVYSVTDADIHSLKYDCKCVVCHKKYSLQTKMMIVQYNGKILTYGTRCLGNVLGVPEKTVLMLYDLITECYQSQNIEYAHSIQKYYSFDDFVDAALWHITNDVNASVDLFNRYTQQKMHEYYNTRQSRHQLFDDCMQFLTDAKHTKRHICEQFDNYLSHIDMNEYIYMGDTRIPYLVKTYFIMHKATVNHVINQDKVKPEFYGKIKDKIEITIQQTRIVSATKTRYGIMKTYQFIADGYMFQWKTSNCNLTRDDTGFKLQGCIKSHIQNQDVKITELTRCKVIR